MTPVSSSLRPTIVLCGWRLHSFKLCGAMGLVLATALAGVLISEAGLSHWVGGGLLASGVLTFLVLAMVSKILTGREALIYYHHEVAVLASAALLLSLLALPVLPYLDLNALWLGVFLACGRCGCLMVGCCHGRPHRWGVRYGEDHAAEGFPACYVGVRLFPVQVLEALVVISIVAVGTWQFLQGRPAGTVLSTYVVSYSVARIWLEELRGDDARPHWGRFSEAQWTSLLLVAGALLGEWQGRLPWSGWHFALGAAAAVSMLVLAGTRRAQHAVLHPRHASEVADIVRRLEASQGGAVSVRRTSQSIGISTQSLGRLREARTVLYSLSRADRRLKPDEARALAGLITQLARAQPCCELRPGGHGVFHLILRDAQQPDREKGALHA
ncbi:prolipoprotein diacylglyceryl transferase family protein [Variovorax sp. RA8]|uniref:prolipoprotein diacylglyceryl transferase family protein n=1 Tax=Variovorax sp. (strain JCM 16519 / RA8) TaxID=662548 RepID=UPI001316FFF1|nr:prolipoprotein diacylglyceryl transferase family protein [Variovorax sp. RA8]VTU28740.1 prolipoprotein diacylglyceryl transferase [Variovorax sp. RA8]